MICSSKIKLISKQETKIAYWELSSENLLVNGVVLENHRIKMEENLKSQKRFLPVWVIWRPQLCSLILRTFRKDSSCKRLRKIVKPRNSRNIIDVFSSFSMCHATSQREQSLHPTASCFCCSQLQKFGKKRMIHKEKFKENIKGFFNLKNYFFIFY